MQTIHVFPNRIEVHRNNDVQIFRTETITRIHADDGRKVKIICEKKQPPFRLGTMPMRQPPPIIEEINITELDVVKIAGEIITTNLKERLALITDYVVKR